MVDWIQWALIGGMAGWLFILTHDLHGDQKLFERVRDLAGGVKENREEIRNMHYQVNSLNNAWAAKEKELQEKIEELDGPSRQCAECAHIKLEKDFDGVDYLCRECRAKNG